MSRTNIERLQRYRQKNQRWDYYPSPDVADIISHYQGTGPEKCLAGVIDGLVRVAHRAIVSGNKGQPK